jgi:excisionase family DNA binding protein
MLSLSEAAKVTGQSKSTIWRAVKSGGLSATKTDGGDYQIDYAELHRVFPIGTGEGRASGVSVTRDATYLEQIETALMKVQIDNARQIAERLRNELDNVRKDRDAWRSKVERLLLTHSAGAAKTAVAKPTGWLRRLVG